MIIINRKELNIVDIINEYNLDRVERNTLEILYSSDKRYNYQSLKQLIFEMDLRSNIVKASLSLNRSRFEFEVFRESRCNPKYWDRTDNGGFLLKDNVKPSEAIEDIYKNSSMYGTECATAIVIVYYKAILNIYQAELFDNVFKKIHLMNWHYMDSTIGVNLYKNQADYLPGDCRYFRNPDVDPLNPEWQGENAIDLSNGKYYAHGMGIRSSKEIIRILNRLRKEDATESAYLLDSATRPNFNRLEKVYFNYYNTINYYKNRVPFRY